MAASLAIVPTSHPLRSVVGSRTAAGVMPGGSGDRSAWQHVTTFGRAVAAFMLTHGGLRAAAAFLRETLTVARFAALRLLSIIVHSAYRTVDSPG